MSKLISAILFTLFAANVAMAETPAKAAAAPAASDCEAKAIDKNGKPLAGAAKTASIKKCESAAKGSADAGAGCESKAISKAGKPLAGAAKTAFMKKCEGDAKAGK